MPLVSWFSQPQPPPPDNPGNFSSYYMYETRTRQFCRIRLELGRAIVDAPSGNQTVISYASDRVVGFSQNNDLPSTNDDRKWSVNRALQLCYDGAPLAGPPPESGVSIYDTQYSGAGSVRDIHVGNPVTTDPKLPPGIAAKHLALLAQEALIERKELPALTAGTATPRDLAEAIQARVAALLEVPGWGDVNDGDITAKLQDQAGQICLTAGTAARTVLKDALKTARTANSEISKQLASGSITRNPELETAVTVMQSALGSAADASDTFDVKETLGQIAKAQQALATALTSIGADKSAATLLAEEKQSLSEAEQAAGDWQTLETGYQPLLDAGNVEEYMSTLSTGGI